MLFRRPPHQFAHRFGGSGSRAVAASRARPMARIAVATAAIVLLAAACTGGDDAADPGQASSTSFTLPPAEAEVLPSVEVPEGFVLKDARGISIPAFGSKPKKTTTPPLPVYGGGAAITGHVTGPDGPVAGAPVLLERVVGDRSGQITLSTNADGGYSAKGLHGGKYRIRAWVAPTLASRNSSLAYVADLDGRATVDLSLETFNGRTLQLGLDISSLNVGDTAHVRALLTDQVVGADGIVVGQGIDNAEVKLAGSGSMSYGDDKATTNAEGRASWEVTCTREGPTTFTATTQGASGSFTSPSCGPKPTTTTAGDIDVPDFAVGDEFDVPHKGVLPAGTYATFLDGCKTSYEVYVNGSWSDRKTASGSTMTLPGPGRDFKPADGSKGCTYRRQS